PGVAHPPVRLADARGDRPLHLHDTATGPQSLRSRSQDLDDRRDLALVVHAARIEHSLGHAIHTPLLTSSVWPVMDRARSDARNTTASATSSGVGKRRNAVSAAISSRTTSGVIPRRSAIRTNIDSVLG